VLRIFLAAILLAASGDLASAARKESNACDQISFDKLLDELGCVRPYIRQYGLTVAIESLRQDNQKLPNQNSACQLDVHYVHFSGPQHGLGKINKAERDLARQFVCSDDLVDVERTIYSVSASPLLLSIFAQDLQYCDTCSGSCHGHFDLITYDTGSGNTYTVVDVVKAADLPGLTDRLVTDFMARYGSLAEGEDARKSLANEVRRWIAAEDLKMMGLYADGRKVWVNIDDFVFSCVDGNLYPVEIPSSILKDDFLQKLQSLP